MYTSAMMGNGNIGFFGGFGSYGSGMMSGGCGCEQRVLGGRRKGGLIGSIIGGVVGGVLSCGNPLGILGGIFAGGALGRLFDGLRGNNCCGHQQNPHAGCYPSPGGNFGGPCAGGYGGFPSFPQMPPFFGGGFPGGGFPGCNFPRPGIAPGGCFPPYQPNWGGHCPPQQCPRPCPRPLPGPWGPRPQGPTHPNGGQLCGGNGKPVEYTTSGGYKVKVNKHTILVTDPSGKKTLKTWGDPHMNLINNENGKRSEKHITDWQKKDYTLMLPDGTKITMHANNPKGVTNTMSIYDRNQAIQIDNRKNSVTHRSFDARTRWQMDAREADGQTAFFGVDRHGDAIYNNLYFQGNDFKIQSDFYRVGGIINGQIHDFFDDPTHSRT